LTADDLRRAAALLFVADLDHPEIDDEDRHHVLDVVRLRDGEPVAVADGGGRWRMCRYLLGGARRQGVTAVQRRPAARSSRAWLEPCGDVVVEPLREPLLGVGFALGKGDRPELTVQKLTELGVDELYPFVAARSVVRLEHAAAARRMQRLRRVAREAAAQSRRARLPAVHDLAPFAEVVGALHAGGASLAVAEPGSPPLRPGMTHLLVGPEGGFVAEELDLVATRVRIATLILRTETAAIAAGCLLTAMRDGIGAGVQAAEQAVHAGAPRSSW
jgi:16S rRNA (uracil1498-N3)-methyltransferase